MRPSTLKPGTKLKIKCIFGQGDYTGFFVRREPAKGKGIPAVNYVRFPAFEGLNGPNDDGTCQMSDYELSRRGEVVL